MQEKAPGDTAHSLSGASAAECSTRVPRREGPGAAGGGGAEREDARGLLCGVRGHTYCIRNTAPRAAGEDRRTLPVPTQMLTQTLERALAYFRQSDPPDAWQMCTEVPAQKTYRDSPRRLFFFQVLHQVKYKYSKLTSIDPEKTFIHIRKYSLHLCLFVTRYLTK